MSRGAQVRDTIELLCKILKDNGMSKIEAEILRKAKFDKQEACAPLWRLLFELISFCQRGVMDNSVITAFTNMSTEDQVMVVKMEMQKRGYLSRSFASLPVSMQGGSRELLLALAWLLNKESLVTRFMEQRSSPVDDDILSLYESVESEEAWKQPAFVEKEGTVAHRVQQMLVLNYKLKMNLRLLHSSQQEYATLTHKIHNSTYGVSLSPNMNHLTTMQTYMLRHPQHMAKVLTLLEDDSTRLENLLQWEDRNIIFWEWMESVLEIKLQQMMDTGDTTSENGTTSDDNVHHTTHTIFLDVPPTIAADIAESRRNLMNMILHYESAIERLEDLWTTKRSTVSEWQLDRLLNDINAEISQLQSCLGQDAQCAQSQPAQVTTGPALTLVKNKTAAPVHAKVSNALAASGMGRDAAEEGGVSVRAEIGRLQQEADRLEKELTDMRRACLRKLNSFVAAAAPNTVCVIPPPLRHLCQ